MKHELLRFDNLSKWNNGKQQFSDIDLTICEGEITGLISDNLQVQWFLCEILKGNILPDGGAVYIECERMVYEDCAASLKKQLVFLERIETYSYELSVEDIFYTSSWIKQKSLLRKEGLRRKIREEAERYHIDLPVLDMKAEKLTNLKRCQIALLRAEMCGVKIIVLKEISSFLNTSDRQFFFETVREFEKYGMAFLMIDHDLSLVVNNTDRMEIFEKGCTTYMLDDYSEPNMQHILQGDLNSVNIDMQEKQRTGEIVLKMNGILSAIQNKPRSITISQGEIVGLLDNTSYMGDEILKLLQGLITDIKAEIFLNSQPYKPRNLHDAIKKGIGFVTAKPESEKAMLLRNMLVGDNLLLTLSEKQPGISLSKYQKSLRRMCLDFFGRDISKETVSGLDLLDQQRLIYFRWLLYNPAVLVCEKPFSGSNVYVRQVTEQMLRFCADHNIAILIISTGKTELYSICDRLIVLD